VHPIACVSTNYAYRVMHRFEQVVCHQNGLVFSLSSGGGCDSEDGCPRSPGSGYAHIPSSTAQISIASMAFTQQSARPRPSCAIHSQSTPAPLCRGCAVSEWSSTSLRSRPTPRWRTSAPGGASSQSSQRTRTSCHTPCPGRALTTTPPPPRIASLRLACDFLNASADTPKEAAAQTLITSTAPLRAKGVLQNELQRNGRGAAIRLNAERPGPPLGVL
jgi:hypothetical protein